MAKIEIIKSRHGQLYTIGHFVTHLSPEECAENISADGMTAFADWSGEFLPTENYHEGGIG